MELESIKTVFLLITFVIISLGLFRQGWLRNSERKFFIISLLLTGLLIFVISIKLHHLLNRSFNISSTFTYGLIALLIISNFIYFKNIIINTKIILLIFSIISFSIGAFLDLVSDIKLIKLNYIELVEELFRILGSIFWMLYYFLFIRKNWNN